MEKCLQNTRILSSFNKLLIQAFHSRKLFSVNAFVRVGTWRNSDLGLIFPQNSFFRRLVRNSVIAYTKALSCCFVTQTWSHVWRSFLASQNHLCFLKNVFRGRFMSFMEYFWQWQPEREGSNRRKRFRVFGILYNSKYLGLVFYIWKSYIFFSYSIILKNFYSVLLQ